MYEHDTSFCRKFHVLQVLCETFSSKMLNPTSESSQLYLKTRKKPKKIAFLPSSFCQEFYTLQLLYEAFSTKMLKSASELSQLLKNTKKPEKDAFPPSCFGRCSLSFRARPMYDTSLYREFVCFTTFVWNFFHKSSIYSRSPQKIIWKGATRRQRPRAKCLPAVLHSLEGKETTCKVSLR